MTYKCIVIDDSSVHRLAISFLIKNHPNLELVGAYSNPFKGIEEVFKHKADIVFLDVLLEKVNAFQLLDAITIPSTIVLHSSWERFSAKAKAYCLQHFLLKPMRKDDFEATVNGVIKSLEKKNGQSLSNLKPYLVKNPNVFRVHATP